MDLRNNFSILATFTVIFLSCRDGGQRIKPVSEVQTIENSTPSDINNKCPLIPDPFSHWRKYLTDENISDRLSQAPNDFEAFKIERRGDVYDMLERMPPVRETEIRGKKYLLSRVFELDYNLDKRSFAILYSLDENMEMVGNLVYQSDSAGTWRVTPYLKLLENSSSKDPPIFYISKGANINYTQETKLDPKIIEDLDLIKRYSHRYFESLEAGQVGEFFLSAGDQWENFALQLFTENVTPFKFSENIEDTLNRLIRNCRPGECFYKKPFFKIEDEILSVNSALKNELKGLMPDFSSSIKPEKEWYFENKRYDCNS